MKKVLTASLLGVLLSIPSTVFAEASWYGSIRTGISSEPGEDADGNPTPAKTGVADFASRWGIQGSSEVSEGLTAIYRYERSIDSSDASEPDGRLSYVGLSGGFGTVTIGKVWGAAYNHFGGIVDQALWYGSTGETGDRFADAVSYAVSVGNVSLQADAIMDQSTGKTGDGFNFGATLGGLMETGSIAIAYRKHEDAESADRSDDATAVKKMSSSFVAGNYGIGDMTVFVGYSRDSMEDVGCTRNVVNTNQKGCFDQSKTRITFAGVHGGVGDTGVNYVFTMRSAKKTSRGTKFEFDNNNSLIAGIFESKSTPWTLGLSRSLGGGATLKFEHGEPDSDADSSTAIWLQVDF